MLNSQNDLPAHGYYIIDLSGVRMLLDLLCRFVVRLLQGYSCIIQILSLRVVRVSDKSYAVRFAEGFHMHISVC